jgi:hypothetical protein
LTTTLSFRAGAGGEGGGGGGEGAFVTKNSPFITCQCGSHA